jgi:hypothetical protein
VPIVIESVAGGTTHTSPIISPITNRHHIKVDISGLTTAEVDAYGYLKPGVPLRLAGGLGVLISAPSQVVDGVTIEQTKIAADNASATLAAATDCLVAVATHVTVNRDLGEDVLGRAYSADEIAALAAAFIYLTST